MLPGDNFKEVASKALELVESGFNPVPHFPARSIKNLSNLNRDQYYSLNLSILKCDFKNLITKDFYIIQTLIALCPVLGLLGTVTGMIEVFDVVSFFGTGNARALASGITKATLPTMTGMAISIVGLLTFTVINSKSQTLISEL